MTEKWIPKVGETVVVKNGEVNAGMSFVVTAVDMSDAYAEIKGYMGDGARWIGAVEPLNGPALGEPEWIADDGR